MDRRRPAAFPSARTGAAVSSRPATPIVRLPGVYAPQQDTWLLVAALDAEVSARSPDHRRVLELGTGSGAVALSATRHPGARVTATDVSRRALASAWTNAALRGHRIRVRRGDLTAPMTDQLFDVVAANPPYVPCSRPGVPATGAGRAWDAGVDGRAVLDRLCAEAPKLLTPGGTFLLVHSALAGVDQTLHQLAGDGLHTEVVVSCSHRFGPVLRSRAAHLYDCGLIAADQVWEELVVVRATRPST